MKKTLVLGASFKTERYSNLAVHRLLENNYDVVGIGLKEGAIEKVTVYTGMPLLKNIHTITLYLNPKRQVAYYDYILSLQPKRIIFNPGTENTELERLLEKNNIFFERACTLVLLSTKQY